MRRFLNPHWKEGNPRKKEKNTTFWIISKQFVRTWWQKSWFWWPIDLCTKNMTQVNCKFLLMKSSKKYFIFLPAFYPIYAAHDITRDSRWMSYEDSKKWVFPCIYPLQILMICIGIYRQKICITDQNIVNFQCWV